MIKQMNTTLIGNTLLFIFSALILFHVLVLCGIVPYDIVWAGKISNQEQLLKMESISIALLLLVITLVASKMEYFNLIANQRLVNIGLWSFFGFFILNTIGNLTAKNPIEKWGFGLLTLLIAFLLFKLVQTKD